MTTVAHPSAVHPHRRLCEYCRVPANSRRRRMRFATNGSCVTRTAEDGCFRRLGPFQQPCDVLLFFTSPRVLPEGHHLQTEQPVENPIGQPQEAIGVQVEVSQPGQPVQRSGQDLHQIVVRQVDALQVVRHIRRHRPEPVVTQVESLEIGECVVDEDHSFQLIVGQVQHFQVPVVGGVVFLQRT